ncbi:MAG TPA: GNAT family N-acetyltransferase, partial [Stellaceae bacterium]|nr:GNAT family N-acetyltransferase [Stellaceae bacterium]
TAWLGEKSARPARRILDAARIATYETPDSSVRGFMHRVRHYRAQELLLETPAARPDEFAPDAARARRVIAAALGQGREWLDAEEVAQVLSVYGIPLPKSRLAGDSEGAAEAAAAIGTRVALKIRSPDLVHKSDLGGVVLDLDGSEAVRIEAVAMLERLAAARPGIHIDGFLVQEMVRFPGALELILGIVGDAVFGPVILFGQGGTAVEVVRDTTLELPPLNEALARAQMARTRVWRLLQGYRGQPQAALDMLALMLVRVGQLAAEQPEIRELDINPLLAGARGVVALDARLRVGSGEAGAERLAIRPYPKELEKSFVLRDGTRLFLRPIRPEDEPLLQELAGNMSPEDLRMRFFTPIRGLSHRLAARLSQIDYDREMALVAFPECGGPALGVARFSADPDNARAEYAIGVRTDWHGRGLGYLLMNRLIEVARGRGIGELVGEVLRENTAMLRMARELGFSVAGDPADPSLVEVRKPLREAAGRRGPDG